MAAFDIDTRVNDLTKSLRSSNKKLQKEIEEMKTKLEDARTKYEDANRQIEQEMYKASAMDTTELIQMNALNEEYRQTIINLQDQVRELKTTCDEQKTQLMKRKASSNAGQDAEAAEFQSKVVQCLTTGLKENNQMTDTMAKAIDNMTKQNKESEARITACLAELTTTHSVIK